MAVIPKKVRGFVFSTETGHPLPGVVILATAEPDDGIYFNVGLLVSDHAGYVSFDLSPLISKGQTNLKSLWLSPIGDEKAKINVLDKFVDSKSGFDFIFKVSSQIATHANSSIKLPSIQNEDIIDWRISPYSLSVKNETGCGGEGCCDSPSPSSSPTRDYRFYRVIRKMQVPDQSPRVGYISPVDPTTSIEITEDQSVVRFGEVLQFRQRWFPLSHSLGQILYSLPLAPCESVKLAVIDWSREDTLSREDRVTATEKLFHNQRRDRSIEETIDAALRESQGGWSLMGGSSGATRGAASATIPIEGVPVDLSGGAASTMAVGGGITNSWGNRNLEAESNQELHDTIKQASSSVRSLNSTVIIQATQRESNTIQTRIVTNHNHCHALTVQYYEVLRNFRVVTEYEGKRPVVLIPYRIVFLFNRATALRFRSILESVLLQEKFKSLFDALVRLQIGDAAYDNDTNPERKPEPNPSPPAITYFSGSQTFIVNANSITDTSLDIEKGSTIVASAKSTHSSGVDIKFQTLDRGNGYGPQGDTTPADSDWPGKGLHRYALLAKIGPDFYEVGAGATFIAKNGGKLSFQFNDTKLDDNSGAAEVNLSVTRPSNTEEPLIPPEPQTEKPKGFDKKTDEVLEKILLSHLDGNAGYYNRAIWMLQDDAERTILLEQALAQYPHVLNGLDPTPLAISGNYVAFAFDDPKRKARIERFSGDIEAPEPIESIISFPTRGLFAEAQLGHCNSCEVRDVTRFWKWEESPCQMAPDIQGITPGPKGQQPTAPQPIQLPQSIVQITPPQPAPDPTGLAAAIKVLGTPNIFRDMSGLQEVSKLLDSLVKGTVDLAKAQEIAKDITSKGKSATTIEGKQAPSEPNPSDQVDKLDAIQYAKDSGLINDKEATDAATGVLGGGRILLASSDAGFVPDAGYSSDAGTMVDSEIEALDLEKTAKEAAYALRKRYPSLVFTSGRRTVIKQAEAMASNIIKSGDRKWIEKTYKASTAITKLQKWVDDNPTKTTESEIAEGLLDTLNSMTSSEQSSVSKHLTGEAFDIRPVTVNADEIKDYIKSLKGITKFLDKEGDLIIWHAQF